MVVNGHCLSGLEEVTFLAASCSKSCALVTKLVLNLVFKTSC